MEAETVQRRRRPRRHGRRSSRLHRGAEAHGAAETPGQKRASFWPTAEAQEVKAVQRGEGPDCPVRLVLTKEYSGNVP